MPTYAVCAPDGQIQYTTSGPSPVPEQPEPPLFAVKVLDSVTDSTHYYDTASGGVLTKLAMGVVASGSTMVADGVDTFSISGIPAGVFITWPDMVKERVTDGTIEFQVDLAGVYEFVLEAPEFIREVITVEAITPA